MTLRTALVVSGDTAEAKRALADLDQAMGRAEQSTAELGREGVKASVAMDRLRNAEREAASAGIELSKSQRQAAMHGKDLGIAVQAQSAILKTNTEMTNAQRAGSQQLAMQLGDVATMYSLGARPMQIFASQGMQVVQAIGLMQGGAKGLIGFLGSPWGLGVMAATTALVPLVSSLWEAEEAMEAVELASDGMSQAQSVLAKIFDTTTGAIKEQNEQLRLNAQLMAINLRAEAEAKKASAQGAFGNFERGSMGLSLGQKALGAFGIPVGGAVQREMEVRGVLRDMQSGKIDRVEAARRAEGLDFDGLAISKSEFLQAIADDLSSGLLRETASKIESSIENGQLDPDFRTEPRGGGGRRSPRPKKDRSAEKAARIEERYFTELARNHREELQARLALATSIEDEEQLRLELLGAERDERERQIRADKDLSEKQQAAMLAHLDVLYGKRDPVNGSIVVNTDRGLLGEAELERIRSRQLDMEIEMLAMQARTLDAQADVAMGLGERYDLQRRALELQHQIEEQLLEQAIAEGRIADAAKARALLQERQAADREGQRQDQRGPLEIYVDDMDMDAEEMRQWGQQLIVDELEHFRDGMREAVTDWLGVDDPLLSGLIDMLIQQLVIKPLAEGLEAAGAGDWLGGLFSGIAGAFGFGGGRAEGGPVTPGNIYAVNERSTAPGLFIPMAPGRIDPAGANDNGRMGGMGQPIHNHFNLAGAVVLQDLLDEMNAIARGEANAAVAGYDQIAAGRVQEQLERRS